MAIIYANLVEAGLRALDPNDQGIIVVPKTWNAAARAEVERRKREREKLQKQQEEELRKVTEK